MKDQLSSRMRIEEAGKERARLNSEHRDEKKKPIP